MAVAARIAILVVDDAEDNLRLVEKMFTTGDRPWDVTTCNNGARAIELTASHWFDLVLLDLEMPSMDGLAVARQMRAREVRGGPRVTIVALTAQTSRAHRANALEVGCDGFLTKPFRRAELLSAIDRYLRG